MAGLVAEACKPENARRIGTPALFRVYIWREKTMRSSSTTGLRFIRANQLSVWVSASTLASAMCTGATPMAFSWSATPPSVMASNWPLTASPRLFRPRHSKTAMGG